MMKCASSNFTLLIMRNVVTIVMTIYSLYVFSYSRSIGENKDCAVYNDTLPYHILGKIERKQIIVDRDIDLHECVCILPKGMTLVFRGGVIKNGTLKGNMTKIESQGAIFNKVRIKGHWYVPQISTSMFVDLNYENSLKDVFALANSKVKNLITVEKGNYTVKAFKNKDACLALNDNTDLILNGNIRIVPNDFLRYDILIIKGQNVSIRGKGTIMGDKHTHRGDEGQWGMGVRFHGAINSSIIGVTVKDCWGDCIYVGGNSKNVLIENCSLDHGRRQGISVTKADSVVIRNCKISNVSGTKPEYAIDIEPNANDTVDHVLIDNVEVVNCEGGLLVTKGKKNLDQKTIGSVKVANCIVSAKTKYPICLNKATNAYVEKCTIYSTNESSAINAVDIDNLLVQNNIIYVRKGIISTLENSVKQIIGKNVSQQIEQIRVKKQQVKNNKVIEQ